MKVLITSDWHLDWTTAGMNRFDDVFAAVNDTVQVAKRLKVDAFIFTGDLTNPDSLRAHAASEVAVLVAATLWNDHGIMSRWVVGNHDVVESGSPTRLPLHTLASVRALEHAFGSTCVRVYDAPTVERFGDLAIVALPFVPRSHAYDPAEFVREVGVGLGMPEVEEGASVLVLSHLNIEGIESGSETTDMPRGREVFLPLADIRKRWPDAVIVNGHYHKRQTFNGVQIPGSLERLTFGEEANEPGFLIVEV